MLSMLIKMTSISLLYVVLTVFLWLKTRNKKLNILSIIAIGIIYGICSILSTHFAVNYGHMLLNLRDVAPLAAGLFFHPVAGVIAGLMGGIERYIVGTYFGIGTYTRIACSVSTCLALAAMEGLKAKEYEMTLVPGDKLFVYTDGIPEAINESVVQYGTDRLLDAINEVKDKEFTQILPHLSQSVADFRGKADQFDDITMLGFEFKKYADRMS